MTNTTAAQATRYLKKILHDAGYEARVTTEHFLRTSEGMNDPHYSSTVATANDDILIYLSGYLTGEATVERYYSQVCVSWSAEKFNPSA